MKDAASAFLALLLMLGFWLAPPIPAFAQGAAPSTQQQTAPRAAWPSARPAVTSAQNAAPAATSGWRVWLLGVQQDLQARLAASIRDIQAGNALAGALALIGLSFLYGVFHAAGPGHGKAVISSYVVANRATARRGIMLSFASSAMQAVSAIIFVVLLRIVLNTVSAQTNHAIRLLEIASAVFIIIAGGWLLVTQLRRLVPALRPMAVAAGGHGAHIPVPDQDHHAHHHHHHHRHHHEHGEDCGCGHAHMPLAQDLQGSLSLRQAAAIVLAVGIRPCTGAILVLIFALGQGMFWAGIAATFAMALGTAITVSALAVLAVGSRDTAIRFAGSRWTERIYGAAGLGGALFVLAFGVLLLMGALANTSPF
jgi:nickel/cobalt transporter (NicO) family protein